MRTFYTIIQTNNKYISFWRRPDPILVILREKLETELNSGRNGGGGEEKKKQTVMSCSYTP